MRVDAFLFAIFPGNVSRENWNIILECVCVYRCTGTEANKYDNWKLKLMVIALNNKFANFSLIFCFASPNEKSKEIDGGKRGKNDDQMVINGENASETFSKAAFFLFFG